MTDSNADSSLASDQPIANSKTDVYQSPGLYVLVFPKNEDPQNHVLSDYLPRVGEKIRYSDGSSCVVEKVEHVLFDNPDNKAPRKAVPAVYVSKRS